jgi:hypothetical protein
MNCGACTAAALATNEVVDGGFGWNRLVWRRGRNHNRQSVGNLEARGVHGGHLGVLARVCWYIYMWGIYWLSVCVMKWLSDLGSSG